MSLCPEWLFFLLRVLVLDTRSPFLFKAIVKSRPYFRIAYAMNLFKKSIAWGNWVPTSLVTLFAQSSGRI